jgi:hypothetical protein
MGGRPQEVFEGKLRPYKEIKIFCIKIILCQNTMHKLFDVVKQGIVIGYRVQEEKYKKDGVGRT